MERLGPIILGSILFIIGSLVSVASAPFFFGRAGVVDIFSPVVNSALQWIASGAATVISPLSLLFSFSLSPTNAPIVFIVALAIALSGLLLVDAATGELTFGLVFALLSVVGIVSSGVNLYDSKPLAAAMIVLAVLGAIAAGVLFGLRRTRNRGEGLYFSAVRVETDPTAVDVEGADGVSWGKTGDTNSKDHPYVRWILQAHYNAPTSTDYTLTAKKLGFVDTQHTWPADFRWKSEWEARRHEAHVKVEMKSLYET